MTQFIHPNQAAINACGFERPLPPSDPPMPYYQKENAPLYGSTLPVYTAMRPATHDPIVGYEPVKTYGTNRYR